MKNVLLLIITFLTINSYGQEPSALSDGAVLVRPVINNEGQGVPYYRHFGVMYKGKVAHYDKTGFHYDSISIFAKNQVVTVMSKGLKGEDLKRFRANYNKIINNYKHSNYDAVKNNCEHFAMELAYGIKKSVQSESTVFLVKTYWEDMKKEILTKSPGAKGYVDMMDTYITSITK